MLKTEKLCRIGVGVRRWMSVQKKTSRSEGVIKPSNSKPKVEEAEGLASDDETSITPASTTEGLAQRLLKPKVRPAEAAEYASYVDQFQNLNLTNELVYESSAGDMIMYERSVRLSRGDGITVDRAAEEVYEKHSNYLRTGGQLSQAPFQFLGNELSP